MKRNMIGTATVGALAAVLVAGGAVGQGPRAGAGAGPGYGRTNANGPGYRTSAQAPNVQAPRYGQQSGPGFRGAGGWWNQVTPQTPEQKAFVDQVSDLHNRIRTANWDLRTLTMQNAPQEQIQAKQQEAASLQNQLQQLTTANQRLMQEMGVPIGYGVCDGFGPKVGQGFGPGKGQGAGAGFGRRGGMGRGMGQGPRDGSGPGRGMRLGPQDGSGPNPDCPQKTR